MSCETTNPFVCFTAFPHRLGKARICTTAWYEIDSAVAAGAEMLVLAGDSVRPFPRPVRVQTTLSRGKLKLPYRILGTRRMCMLHDWLVAWKLPRLQGQIDVIHAWPMGALQTIRVAKRLCIPVALERCNAHTRYAYHVVKKECERIGVPLPPGHEHAFNELNLRREEAEYRAADAMLCPSDFVVKTFVENGYAKDRLVRFLYGVDEKIFYPANSPKDPNRGLRMIYVGVCAVRKGLHYALDAWLKSPASKNGKFLIAGEFIPAYREKLAANLDHPSIEVLGHRTDVPELMRQCDVFVLPSIEEGFGLVCTEAMASGCVPLVSDACTDLCKHMENSMVHPVGDVRTLTEHITRLHENRDLLSRLRISGLRSVPSISWAAAGASLVEAYRRVIHRKRSEKR